MSILMALFGGPAAAAIGGFVSRYMTPLIIAGGIGVAVLAIGLGLWWLREDAAAGALAECHAGQLKVVITELQRRLEAAKSLAAETEEQAEKTAAEVEILQKLVSDYEQNRSGDSVCVLDPADAERLQQIR